METSVINTFKEEVHYMKEYIKPSIEVLSFSQKEQVAADCRYCYAGYEDGASNCTSQNVCWTDGGADCIPEDYSYGVA